MTLSWLNLTTSGALVLALAAASSLTPGCAPAGNAAGDDTSNAASYGAGNPAGEGAAAETPLTVPSFEEFRATVYREPWPGGHYIVERDLPLRDDNELRAYYDSLHFRPTALVIGTQGAGREVLLPPERRLDLSYCVDQTFSATERKSLLEALLVAAARWEAITDVHFRYAADRDTNCVASETDIYFVVTKADVPDAYRAKAFFPDFKLADRKLMIRESAFVPALASGFDDLMTHEFGHILGFRHEHGRNEANAPQNQLCRELSAGWRAFTPYDAESVMGYPECTGSQQLEFQMSPRDEWAARTVYGSPGRRQPIEGAQVSSRSLVSLSTTLAKPETTFRARGGSVFVAVLRGSNRSDTVNLYVRLGQATEIAQIDGCKTAFDVVDMPQVCRVPIPAGADADVHVGYKAGGISTRVDGALSVVYVQGN